MITCVFAMLNLLQETLLSCICSKRIKLFFQALSSGFLLSPCFATETLDNYWSELSWRSHGAIAAQILNVRHSSIYKADNFVSLFLSNTAKASTLVYNPKMCMFFRILKCLSQREHHLNCKWLFEFVHKRSKH